MLSYESVEKSNLMKKIKIYALGLVATLFFDSTVYAGNLIFVDTNLFYSSGSFNTGTTASQTRMLYDVCIGFAVSKGSQFQIGWNYTGQSFADNSGTETTTYSTAQMGPRFIYYFDKDRSWRTSIVYNLSTTGNYTVGSSPAEKWKGTGLGFDFGYQLKISERFGFGIRFNYSSTTYSESLVNQTTYSTISYSRTHMYPSLAMSYEYQ